MEKITKPFEKPIYVTRPLLPKLSEINKKIKEIFESRWLTNFGKQHAELEKKLLKYLKCENIQLFCNGTLALELGCRALNLSGEVITTPFTFAATPHALLLNNISPVFCDIEQDSFNIDPDKIERLITPKTTAILAVHVFGNPCKVDEIEKIAKKHHLKVVYDAAHAFGVKINGVAIGNFGDISMFSFHATKIFHTIEGGCLTFKDKNLNKRLRLLKNFGILDEENVVVCGTNAKMNEIQAAIGLINLRLIDQEIKKRAALTKLYRKELSKTPGIKTLRDKEDVKYNYSYFPILIDEEKYGLSRDKVYEKLKGFNIFTRKYFHPICSHFKCYRDRPSAKPNKLPVAEMVDKKILCLPIYGSLKPSEVKKICKIIKEIKNGLDG